MIMRDSNFVKVAAPYLSVHAGSIRLGYMDRAAPVKPFTLELKLFRELKRDSRRKRHRWEPLL